MLGHRPLEAGELAVSRHLEDAPLQLFPAWRLPVLVSACCWALLHTLAWLGAVLCHHGDRTWDLDTVLATTLTTTSTTCSTHALTLLAVAMSGRVARDYLLLVRGTKYAPLPRWLAAWAGLGGRVVVLVVPGLLLHSWAAPLLPRPRLAALPPGVAAQLALLLLGACLHPATRRWLSRRERQVAGAGLGWAGLVLASLHAVMSDWAGLAVLHCLPSPHQLALLLPTATIFLQVTSPAQQQCTVKHHTDMINFACMTWNFVQFVRTVHKH